MAVRMRERVAMLAARRLIVCLARFSADLILATGEESPQGTCKKEARILPMAGAKGKGNER
jgi:hypothetical protein